MDGWDVAKIAGLAGLVQLLIVALLRPALLFALDQRYAPKGTSAATRDVDGLGRKVDALVGLFERADGRWGEVEDRTKALEINSQHEWSRISKQMEHTAELLDRTTGKLQQINDDHIRLMTEWGIRNNPDATGRRATTG
jgi:hypothetical protein